MRVRARRAGPWAVLAVAVAAVVAAIALAATTNCAVAAGGGYANCLTVTSPGYEQARSWHAAGRPYRFQLHRPSDGALWGWWEWNDGAYHTVYLSLSGGITAQVDNRGSGTTSYHVAMD